MHRRLGSFCGIINTSFCERFLRSLGFSVSHLWLQICLPHLSRGLRSQQSKDVDSNVQVPMSLLLTVADAFHVKTMVAIYAQLLDFIFFVFSLGAPCAAMILDSGQVFAYIHHTSSFSAD
jgi:hypothetical protein